MLLFCHLDAGQNHDIKIAKRCFENVAQFKYLAAESNKSKRDLEGNFEATVFEYCLLPFSTERLVFASGV
jgi:hypothetical protein